MFLLPIVSFPVISFARLTNVVIVSWPLAIKLVSERTTWEFPTIGDPNMAPLIVGSLL